ncbi:hypothetical protein [Pseudoalteromonas phenolica]|uniref:hypothetical protein n=1 Tax=Pseudoalteromonas phenolica TaxID=161398 RepID=UPI000717B73E|nr:hypothetical protein [Pseudoalteromonas phenolica]RXF06124.1 hypothetical protein D9981_01740 [Pseudoalteromonas phenolica O-BC30]
MAALKYKIVFQNNRQDLRAIALVLLVISFVTFLVTAHLYPFLFICLAALLAFYVNHLHIKNTTPFCGTVLFDTQDNYIEIHSVNRVCGQVVCAKLQFLTLSIKIRTSEQKDKTVQFVASSMIDRDWRRLCRFALNEQQYQPSK